MEHTQKVQGISFYIRKNEEWKNNLENVLLIVWEFFNLKTQYPGPLFWLGFWDLIAVERAKFSRKAPMLGYLLNILYFSQSAECSILVKTFLFDAHLINKSQNKRTICIRKKLYVFLLYEYIYFVLKYEFFWKREGNLTWKSNSREIYQN